MNNLTTSIATFLAVLLLAACGRQPQYPQQLVEADSAMRWGQYDQADSLLQAYEKASKTKKNATHRYYQLLTLESKFLLRKLNINDLFLADSLCNYFKKISSKKYAIALAIQGDIYYTNSDYPSALDFFLQSNKKAREENLLWLQSILYKEEGDIYLDQRLFDEMIDCFLRSYQLACTDKDTLRMANAAIRLGKVHTYLQNVDSIIFYYKKAIELANRNKQGQKIVQAASFDLADIYLQTEEFDKAAAIMSRDTLFDVNWGYWHYQQNHSDSAIYYFKKSLSRYNYYADAEYLDILSDIEEKKGNLQQAIVYLRKCIECKDSSQILSQKEATLKAATKYNLNSIKERLLQSEQVNTYWEWGALCICLFFAIAFLLVRKEWRRQRKDKAAAIAREQQLRQEFERKHKQSRRQIEENNIRIQQLEQQLIEARLHDDQARVQLLQLDTDQLRAENANIEATNERKEHLLREFHNSRICQRVMVNAGNPKFHLREEEWSALSEWIDKVYDNFTTRLLALTPLNITERQICYLVKIKVKPTQIANMLSLSDTAISMNRKRLYQKIFKEKGSAKDFDEFILNF